MKRFHIIYWKEGAIWVASCLENDVVSQGYSYEEAKKNIQEAIEFHFEDEDSDSMNLQISDIKTEVLEFA